MKKKCFIISPISSPKSEIRARADDFRRLILQPALESEYELKRADDDSSDGMVWDAILNDVRTADLCVVDLHGFNSNVMIELGIRLQTERDCVIMLPAGEPPPFDISGIRLIPYEMTGEGPSNAIRDIRKRVASLREAKLAPSAQGALRILQEDVTESELAIVARLMQEHNQIVNSLTGWVRDSEAQVETWHNVEFRSAMGLHPWGTDPKQTPYLDANDSDRGRWPGHKRSVLSFTEKAGMGITWPGVVYRTGEDVCVASRGIQEYALWALALARHLYSGAITSSSVRYFWRTLDIALPRTLRIESDKTTDYPKGGCWRWIEFFVFANSAMEGLAESPIEKVVPWISMHKAATAKHSPFRIDHRDSMFRD